MIAYPPTLLENSLVQDVVNLFYKYKIEAVPIVKSNGLICGIVTRSNIIEAMLQKISLSNSVSTIMTKSVITVLPDIELEEAWKIPVKHLPVVDKQNKIVGMLGRRDFLEVFYQEMLKAKSTVKQLLELNYSGVLIVNNYGIIKSINSIAERIIGVESSAILGKCVDDVVPNTDLMNVIMEGKIDKEEIISIGNNKYVVNRSPIYEECRIVGAISIIQDVVKNLKEQELQEINAANDRQSMLENILESLPQGIIVVDLNNKVLFANSSYEEIMGIPRDRLMNSSAEETIENSRLHVVLKTGVSELGKVQTVKGRKVVVNRVPIFKDGEMVGALGEAVFKDIQELESLLKRGKMAGDTSSNSVERKPGCPAIINFECIVGRSRKMIHAKNLASKVAVTDTTVLIQGESGTGKDLFAQAIHNASTRKNNKFVAINCAAIPVDLLEAELFGYDEGAFTGAKRGGKKGKFEIAEGGTLFLDEIGDMPLPMQAKLLRVMQNKTFEHVGGEQVKKCDVRIIAATNQNLKKMVDENKFREDLYYRLNVVCVETPPLRERQEDICELISLLMPEICAKLKVQTKQFAQESLDLLRSYSWPGNVRELVNVLEQIGATVSSMIVMPKHLPSNVLQRSKTVVNNVQGDCISGLGDEERRIREVLKDTKGNKVLAAKVLGIHRSTLYEKIKKYGI